ncbi:hypothetical protein TNCV_3614761 [Trichonephila clavipes]|uniref:Mutator-like transposase domain-containing protein n=1 Tax=Trichonephila clavipes TaxID=2585209 RepID=A0A8X6VN02_TRICX|nr:hypothetical protein TNCV_3614761 [Trichonephila clavipes]
MDHGKPVAILLVLACAVIGDKTGKCIDAEVMSSFCKDVILGNEERAGMMETVERFGIFQRSLSHRSVRYTSYIGDGESKTFSSITASNPYGEDITVSKLNVLDMFKKEWELVYEN